MKVGWVDNTDKKKSKVSASRAFWHRLYFGGQKSCDSAGLADRLLSLKRVKAVSLTENKGVFLAKVRFFKGEEPEDAAAYVSKSLGGDYGTVIEG